MTIRYQTPTGRERDLLPGQVILVGGDVVTKNSQGQYLSIDRAVAVFRVLPDGSHSSEGLSLGTPITAQMPEIVTTAALLVNGVIWTLPRPARHHILLHAWAHAHWVHDPVTNTGHPRKVPTDAVQGFMTSEGRFVDRKEAERIARACGQLKGPMLGHELTSEDLWRLSEHEPATKAPE